MCMWKTKINALLGLFSRPGAAAQRTPHASGQQVRAVCWAGAALSADSTSSYSEHF